jgi:hypothetical protein
VTVAIVWGREGHDGKSGATVTVISDVIVGMSSVEPAPGGHQGEHLSLLRPVPHELA